MFDGAVALAEVEANGIRIDEEYVHRAIRKVEHKIKVLEKQMLSSEVVAVWKRTFRGNMNLNSRDQLGRVLFDVMGYAPVGRTSTGKYRTDVQSLSELDHPFIRSYLELASWKKTLSTNLKGLLKEVVDGYLHAFFNLHTVVTYRSSSDSINFQNIPARDEVIKALVRRAYVARPGHCLVELDGKQQEVCLAACYHKDPTMIDYISDKSKDMHRDMACECYLLAADQVTKMIRYCAKNMMVFPQFYGDWYVNCARSLWEAITKRELVTKDGVPMRDHLEQVGIHSLGDLDPKKPPKPGTFEHHIKEVEKRFWDEYFPVYKQWKKSWWEAYQRRGYFQMLTGFVCSGVMGRNEAINYPVQGTAFHCLLWCLIQLVKKELKKRHMKTLIVGQIHDSILADVPQEELDEFIAVAYELMTKKIREHWEWIIVPLTVEITTSPVGGSWAEMEERNVA